MKKVILAAMPIVFMAAQAGSANWPNQKDVIILYKYDVTNEDIDDLEQIGAGIRYVYNVIPGIAATVDERDIDDIEADEDVDLVDPDGIVYALQQTLPWGVDRIDADLAWSKSKGRGVKVAVVDTGIDYTHPDLSANYKGGYDYVHDHADPMDDNGHGTHCAGIIAAANNGFGVVGVAPEAWLHGVKVLNWLGFGWASDVVAGIEWCVGGLDRNPDTPDDNPGIDIISMSFGGGPNQAIKQAVDEAYSRGVLLVAAAGRNAGPPVSYPAAYDSVIAVSATNQLDGIAPFSSTGPETEFSAPGVDIYSTVPTTGHPSIAHPSGYNYLSGTSMACPHVVGTAALVWADHPWLTNIQVRTRLQDTAEDLGSPGRDAIFGFGLVDANAAPLTPAFNIDIYPNRRYPSGEDTPNWIVLSRNYTIYVAIMGRADFDARDVYPFTVRFGPTGTEAGPVRGRVVIDIDQDGDLDAVYGFQTFDCGFKLGDTLGWLTGWTTAGKPFGGCNYVAVRN